MADAARGTRPCGNAWQPQTTHRPDKAVHRTSRAEASTAMLKEWASKTWPGLGLSELEAADMPEAFFDVDFARRTRKWGDANTKREEEGSGEATAAAAGCQGQEEEASANHWLAPRVARQKAREPPARNSENCVTSSGIRDQEAKSA